MRISFNKIIKHPDVFETEVVRLDKKEALIICSLRQNAREKLTNMSRRIHMPVSTLYERIKVQQQKIIQRFTALLDFTKLGYECRANVCIKVKKEVRDEVKEYLLKHQSVNSLYKINNGFDFLLETVFKNIKELEDFSEELEERFSIKHKQVHYIIEDIKREGFMTQSEFFDF